ncbi:MAG: hypothetical protein II260_02380 [Muribaculaceae bacterium]|nr:hypothetical protein [Muribaculaceae bacterium]
MKKTIFIFISFAISILSYANSAITKDLNKPRPGDNVKFYKIPVIINLNDTSIIDLSSIKVDTDYKITYNQFKDSLLICSQNREVEIFDDLGDSILLISHRKPGLILDYVIPEVSTKYPLNKGENITGIFFAEGTRAMRDYAKISGSYSLSADNNHYSLITPEADTISELFHTKYIRHGSTIIDNDFSRSYKSGDSTVVLPDSIMWHLNNDSITHYIERHCLYARGYRYPILETRLHKVLYLGNTIDSSFVSLYCSKSSQVHDLASDPLNEELRLEDATNAFRSNFGDIANTKSRNSISNNHFSPNNDGDITSSLSENESCDISHLENSNLININYSTSPDCIVAVTLHNSAGALMWQTSDVAYDLQGELSYPTQHLVPGEYLITVFLKNSQYSFKFIKK